MSTPGRGQCRLRSGAVTEDSKGGAPDASIVLQEGSADRAKLIAESTALIGVLHRQTKSWTASLNCDTEPFVELVHAGNDPIDLSSLVAGQRVRLSVLTGPMISKFTIANLAEGVVVELWVPDVPATSHLRSLELRGINGQLELTGFPTMVDVDAENSRGRVVIGTLVEVTVTGVGNPAPCFRVSGGSLELRDVAPLVEVEGSVVLATTIATNLMRRGGIKVLTPVGDADVTFTFPCIPIDHVRNANADPAHSAGATLTLRAHDDHVQDAKTRRIRLGDINGVRVAGTQGVHLECHSIDESILVAPMALELAADAVVVNSTFEAAGNEWVTLTSNPGAAVLSATGHVELRNVAQLQVSASTAGLKVRDSGSEDTTRAVDWTGTVLTGVILPDGLEGRRTLTRLTDAYQFSPDVRQLPGRDQTVVARLVKRRKVTYSDRVDHVRRLHADAEYLREMARVCNEKGAPGSVTTQVAWCAYRLRALKSRGLERAALAVYRCIGYGERPGPAILLWLALSLMLAGPVLLIGGAHWDPNDGVDNFFLEVGRLMLGPLAVLTRSGSLDSKEDFAEIVARTLTAVPLLTGAIALRKYVKAER